MPGLRRGSCWPGLWGCSWAPKLCLFFPAGLVLRGAEGVCGVSGSGLAGPWLGSLPGGQSPVRAWPWQGALTSWAVTTAATLTAALTLGMGVSLGTWHRCWERAARPRFPWSGGAGSGGGASEPLGSFSGCGKNWKARPFLTTSSDFFLSFSLKKPKKPKRGFLVGQPEAQRGHQLTQGSGGCGGGDPGFR